MPRYHIVWLRVAPCSDFLHEECWHVRAELRMGLERRTEEFTHLVAGELEGLLDALLERADDSGAQLRLV